MKSLPVIILIVLFISSGFVFIEKGKPDELAKQLKSLLNKNKFDGKIQEDLEKKLGRKLNALKVNLGKLIFFDKGLGLHQDNSCAGCHAPNAGFGDSQPIAIGVNSNDTVGSHRKGPRNQRRTPTIINTVFYPSLMWNGRFASVSNDPFNTSKGLIFPPPEGDILFKAGTDYSKTIKHLLVAQGHIPFTEQPEMAGFTAAKGKEAVSFSRFSGLMLEGIKEDQITRRADRKASPMVFISRKTANNTSAVATCSDIDFSSFNDGKGLTVPAIDPQINSANFKIRDKVLTLINANTEYKKLFGEIYPEVKKGQLVTFVMVGEVVAEFEFSLTFARSPLDEFAMGNESALTDAQKRGAIVFFTTGKCASCHSANEDVNQMFSDFKMHNAGVPQIYPEFGVGKGNVPFSDLNCPKSTTGTLDFGREEFTGNVADRYMFRTSPLRNLKLQSAFFHNGSFTLLKDAVAFHLNPAGNISAYSPSKYGVPKDLKYRSTDMTNVMKTLDPVLKQGISLTKSETDDLIAFLTDGLFDKRLTNNFLKSTIPAKVPSGIKLQTFEFNQAIVKAAMRSSNHVNELPSADIQFSVYPNPVTGSVNIQPAKAGELTKVEVIDALGKVQLSQKVTSSKSVITLQLHKLKQGTYFIRVTDKQNMISVKQVVKQ